MKICEMDYNESTRCGFDPRAGELNTYCLSDETLNSGPI